METIVRVPAFHLLLASSTTESSSGAREPAAPSRVGDLLRPLIEYEKKFLCVSEIYFAYEQATYVKIAKLVFRD